MYSTIGYATHALLDACTSYGTLLFWPFSYERISWNNISIIDPLFTIPMIILVGLSAYMGKKIFARIAIIWALSYLFLGAILNNKALEIGKEIARERGHEITQIVAKPTFANSFLWKIIYESQGKFFTDGVRILPTKKIYHGESITKLNIHKDFPYLNIKSQQFKDIERFAWFSDNYLAVDPENKIPFPEEMDDLIRLHHLITSRKVTTILEEPLLERTPNAEITTRLVSLSPTEMVALASMLVPTTRP